MRPMPPEEYIRRWKEIVAAAMVDDDAKFWRLYSDWVNATNALSPERLALRKMAKRAADRFGAG